jgi:K+-sensing histidine kinase KdpD
MFRFMRTKLTLLYTTTFTIAVGILMIFLFFALQKVMDKQQIEELNAFFMREQHDFLQQLQTNEPILHIDPTRHFFYYIYDEEGNFIHGDSQYDGLEEVIESYFLTTNTAEKITWQEESLFIIKRPFMLDNRNIGYILTGKTITTQTNFFKKTLAVLLITTLLFAGLIGAISHYFAARAVRPIQQAYDKQRRFVSDASHELRTPLAVFQSSLDILHTESLSSFGKEVLKDAETEVTHMQKLLEQLLTLARADQLVLTTKDKVNLSALTTETIQKFERLTALPIEATITPNLYVIGNEAKLLQVLYILLERMKRNIISPAFYSLRRVQFGYKNC